MVQTAYEMIGELSGKVSEVSDASTELGQVASDFFVTANTFIPLDLAFGYMLFLFELWILATVYRLVKSYIPTLS